MKIALSREYTGRRPTWQGWLLTAILLSALIFGLLAGIYPFLAPQKLPHEGIMIVEGWIPDQSLEEAVAIYKNGNYSKIACTGTPFETGSYLFEFKSYAEMTAARLKKLGIPETDLLVAVGELAMKDRTYLSAQALLKAIETRQISEKKFHLISTGPHGRRSRLLFQKAMGKEFDIGITSLPAADYDPDEWYRCSNGVRTVISESIAYFYIKFFFHP